MVRCVPLRNGLTKTRTDLADCRDFIWRCYRLPQLELKERPCPICGPVGPSKAFASATFDLNALGEFAFSSRKIPEYMHWQLMECTRCDLLYSSPIPAFEELLKLYRQSSFDSRKEAGQASKTYGNCLTRIAAKLPERTGAIDIGTGEGISCRCFKEHIFLVLLGWSLRRPQSLRPILPSNHLSVRNPFDPAYLNRIVCSLSPVFKQSSIYPIH